MTERTLAYLSIAVAVALAPTAVSAEMLSVDRAVQMALQRSTQMINAEAGVLDARGGVYSSYAGVLPSVSAGLSRSGSWEKKAEGVTFFGSQSFPTVRSDRESYSTSPSLNGQWSVLNLSSIAGLRAAQMGMKAAQHSRTAAANGVVLETRRQFYRVVTAVRLADVSTSALHLSRDNERRVRALFEVGSVSRSDLLKSQVQTAQSELDSLTSAQAVVAQRVLLAAQLGVGESELGEVDTVLTAEPRDYDESAVLAEAARNRPDLLAAEEDLRSAEASLRAANFRRLPYVSVNGGATFQPRSNSRQTQYQFIDSLGAVHDYPVPVDRSGRSEADIDYSASISLNLDLFNGFATEGRIASSRALVMRNREARDALRRNLTSEVHRAILDYRLAIESDRVARRAIESATENLKLTQQKYNVGSSTILDLIDAQVQLQRAQNEGVTALAGIRVAEAQLEQVRGGGAR